MVLSHHAVNTHAQTNGAFSAAALARVAGRGCCAVAAPVYACASRGVGGPLKREGRPAAGQ